MFTDDLAYRTASHGVQAFVDVANELSERKKRVAEQQECESYLQLGIDAFHWLMRADEHYRKAVFTKQLAFDPTFDAAFDHLCVEWLEPTSSAENWLASLAARSLSPPNAAEFLECVTEMRALLAESREVKGQIAMLRDKAVQSYRTGDSDEWRQ